MAEYITKDQVIEWFRPYGHCGRELWAYYCEERLFLVECIECSVKALVEARNPKEAAYMSLGGVKEAGR